MKQKPKYLLYPSLIDSFINYQRSSEIWNDYFGFAENPSKTEEEFEKQQFNDLIDKINRVKHEPSEPATKGTAFNEVIDCIIHRKKSEKIQMVSDKTTNTIKCKLDGFEFTFALDFCVNFASQFKDCVSQLFVEGEIETQYGLVGLYGYMDEVTSFKMHDIKTTSKYNAFKFQKGTQHLVYPFCLNQQGNHLTEFEYNVTDFKNVYVETYVYDEDRDSLILANHIERFIEFINVYKDLITDKKIFNYRGFEEGKKESIIIKSN